MEDDGFDDDFAVDLTGGSFEVTLSGAAPPVGKVRGEPLPAARHPDGANLAFAVRGQADDGSEFLMVTVLQQEVRGETFTLVLVDDEASGADAGSRVARLTLGDLEDDPYDGDFRWALTSASVSRVAGQFRRSA